MLAVLVVSKSITIEGFPNSVMMSPARQAKHPQLPKRLGKLNGIWNLVPEDRCTNAFEYNNTFEHSNNSNWIIQAVNDGSHFILYIRESGHWIAATGDFTDNVNTE